MITVFGGFFLGSKEAINFPLFLSTLLGIALVIASGCVFNNYIDRDIDKLMERTKNRASARGLVSGLFMIFYAGLLGVLGTLVLGLFTNALTMYVAWVGLFFYVVLYSLYFKRNSVFGTLIGSVSGAVPPVVGYCAATNTFDLGAVILFLILCFWQMPHSYAIAIYRFQDYAAAKIPVLPVKKNIAVAKISMLVYAILFVLAVFALFLFGYANWIYLVIGLGISLYWPYLVIKGFKIKSQEYADNIPWAKKVFLFSIINITALSIVMAIA